MSVPLSALLWLTHLTIYGSALTCQQQPLAKLPFCDRSLSIAARVADLLPRLSLDQKVSQTGMVAPAVPELGMQQYNFGGEALHGVWSTCVVDNVSSPMHHATGATLCPTQFPAPIHMSSSFNRTLWRQMANISAVEARALYRNNKLRYPDTDGFGTPCAKSLEGCVGLSYYTPNVNLARDPRWGRIEETPGEDPYTNGEYAIAFTQGFQDVQGSEYIKASVTVKHFAAYNLEVDLEGTPPREWCHSELNQGGNCSLPNDRHSFNAQVSARDLTETFLPPFEAAVTASPGAIMCSYNAVNGEPMCTNRELVAGRLRSGFGFEGVVATDCGALDDAHIHHHRYASEVDTVTAGVLAGVDSNCGSVYPRALPWALGNRTLQPSQLDMSVSRLLAARFRLGLFDEGDSSAGVPLYEIGQVDSASHRQLALEAARQGVVLLQNGVSGARAVLPLSRMANQTIAMIGPNANASMNLLSGYHGSAPLLVSPLTAMQNRWGAQNVKYSVGCNVSTVDNQGKPTPPEAVQKALDDAVKLAQAADVVILGLGLCGDNYGGGPPGEDSTCFKITESEGQDRSSLALPGAQMALFRAVLALDKPLVVFVMSAGPVDLMEIKQSGVPIVSAGYGGEFGGQATADVINGDYNPGGATTLTWYPEQYSGLSSFRDMSMRANRTTGNPGRTYRFLDESVLRPLWRFGFGLSFTQWSVSFLSRPPATVGVGNSTTATVAVSNVGEVRGGVVVVCYVKFVQQQIVADPPLRSVFDFSRVDGVNPGDKEIVAVTLNPGGRSLVDVQGVRQVPKGVLKVWCEAGGVLKTEEVEVSVQ